MSPKEEIDLLKKDNAKLRAELIAIESDLVTVVGTIGSFATNLGIDFSQFQGEQDISSSLPQLILSLTPKLMSGGVDLGEIKEILPIINKYKYLIEEIEKGNE